MATNSNNSRNLIIILVVAGIVIFVLGGVAGVLFQNQKANGTAGIGTPINTPGKLADNVKSKVISSIVLYGKVESISGRTAKISNNGDTVSVVMSASAKFSLIDVSKKTPVQKDAKFENIKVGDNLNISAKILDNNSFAGVSVVIFPAKQ